MNEIHEEYNKISTVYNNQLTVVINRDQSVENSQQLTEKCALLNKNMIEKFINYRNTFENRSIIVDILSIFFGIGSWIGINSIFLQLPLFVETAPEGWSLPSYIVVIIQIGNIGPIIYTLLQKMLSHKIRDAYIIYIILLIGTISSLLTAFLYNHTAFIGDKNYSVSLLVLVFFLALNGCTSSVLFMPYMGRFKEIYLITYLIGEGLSGFLPSIVALIQGVGGNPECLVNTTGDETILERYTPPPRFGTMEFFIFVFSVMVFTCIAFMLLENLKKCKNEYAAVKINNGNSYEYDTSVKSSDSSTSNTIKYLSRNECNFLLLLIAVICMFGNGVFPSIESYSCLPYGNNIYHLSVIFLSIANPVACFLAIFLPHTSIKSILLLTIITLIIGIYAVLTAVLSPNPPLIGTNVGGALMVIIWTILSGLVSYIKLCITTVMRSQGGKALVWTGAISQMGSAVGSICIFVLINYTKIFVSYKPC